MAISRSDAVTMILNELGESDAATETLVGQALDLAQRDVARAYPWSELRTRAFFNTEADYSTGTVTTNGTTTITLASGTWPTTVASAKHRFALSVGSQWYQVATRSSDSVILLAQAYIGASASGLSYVTYKNCYAPATDVDRIESLWLHDGTRAIELEYLPSEQWVTSFGHFPTGLGTPSRFTIIERDASGDVQVMLGPEAPTDIYRVECVYRKEPTDGSFSLSEPLLDCVIARAQALVYRRDHFQRYLALNREYERMLAQEVARAGDVEDAGFILGQGRLIGSDDYLRRLMDFGTVESS